MKKSCLIYGAIGCAALSGCVLLGNHHVAFVPDDPNAPPPDGQHPAVGILQAIAAACGQPWAVPIIGAVGGVVACATNAHHGVRNVAVGTAKLAAKPFRKNGAPPSTPSTPAA